MYISFALDFAILAIPMFLHSWNSSVNSFTCWSDNRKCTEQGSELYAASLSWCTALSIATAWKTGSKIILIRLPTRVKWLLTDLLTPSTWPLTGVTPAKPLVRVPSHSGNQGKPGKWVSNFPVRENSRIWENHKKSGKTQGICDSDPEGKGFYFYFASLGYVCLVPCVQVVFIDWLVIVAFVKITHLQTITVGYRC